MGHFIVDSPIPHPTLAVSGVGGVVGAYLTANYANLVSEERLPAVIGVAFVALGEFVTVQQLLL